MLDDLAAIGPFFAVSSHPPGAAPAAPWRPASELTLPSSPLRDRVASVRAALAASGGRAVGEIEPRVAASAVHLGLVARLIAPALGAAVLAVPARHASRRALVAGRSSAARRRSRSRRRRAARPRASAGRPGRGNRRRGEWDRLLLDETVAPVTAAVALLVPVSGRVLWGNVASAVNAAAAQVARQRPGPGRPARGRRPGACSRSPWLRAERNPPGPAFRRSSCCLFYRLAPGNPSAVCGDCVLAGRGSLR